MASGTFFASGAVKQSIRREAYDVSIFVGVVLLVVAVSTDIIS